MLEICTLKVGTTQIRHKSGFLLEGDMFIRAFAQQTHDRLNIFTYPRLLFTLWSSLLPTLIELGVRDGGLFTGNYILDSTNN